MQTVGATYDIATVPWGGKESLHEEDDGDERNSDKSNFLEGSSTETRSMKFIITTINLSLMGQLVIPHCLLLIQDDHPLH